jgi:hypothetical protein
LLGIFFCHPLGAFYDLCHDREMSQRGMGLEQRFF